MYNDYSNHNLQSSNNLKTNSRLPPLRGFGNQKINTQNQSDSSDIESTVGLTKKPRKGYQLANYTTAVQYLHSQSYSKKILNQQGQTQYEQYQVCVDTQALKPYGLGVYLYLQFIKRLAITFLIMSVIYVIPIVYAFINGTGMKNYKESYMIILAKTSLGNIQDGDQTTYMLFTIADLLSMVALFVFYLHWRAFHNQALSQQNRSPQILNPVMYALSVVGFDPKTPYLQKNLQEYINRLISDGSSVQVQLNQNRNGQDAKNFRFQAYEVSAIYNYHGQFSKFVHYDQLVESKQKQKQVMIQTGKSNQQFMKIQKQITQLQDQLSKISEQFEPVQAIIHFQTIKGKHKFIRFCKNYALIDNVSSGLKRFFCCQHLPPQSKLFMGKDALMIKNMNLSRPQQINWPNLDISGCSRIVRWFLSIIFVIISILITSSAIALCTLYVSSTSACTNFDQTTLLAAAQASGGQTLYCYCALHFTQIYTNNLIKDACQGLSNTILYANIMQVGASLVSSISNVLLVIAVGIISKYIYKPDSRPKQYSFIFVGVLLSNYINASVLPLIMNGDIYGFKSLSYLKFIDFIDFSKVAIFKDYTQDWYAIVAPYYMNFLIIAITSPLINLLITCLSGCWLSYKVKKACQNTDKQNPVIQKQANKMITTMQFDLATQKAIVCLNFIIAIMYSSLIPILLPITAIYLTVTFLCKKAIILRYSVRIPADEALSQKIITLMPFIMLLHFLMGIWSHTSDQIFNPSAFLIKLKLDFLTDQFSQRALKDILMLGGCAIIAVWIIFDWTIIKFFSLLSECCEKDSDQIVLPNDLATKQNRSFRVALKSANIQGSYKLVNHPLYGHAIKAYQELKKRKEKQLMKKTMRYQQSSQGNISPQKFGQRTTDTFDMKNNNQISPQKNYAQIQQFNSHQQFNNNMNHPPANNQNMQSMPTMISNPSMQSLNQVGYHHQQPMMHQNNYPNVQQPMMHPNGQNYGYQNQNAYHTIQQ